MTEDAKHYAKHYFDERLGSVTMRTGLDHDLGDWLGSKDGIPTRRLMILLALED